jgi:hypothetical protein
MSNQHVVKKSSDAYLVGKPIIMQVGQPFGPSRAFLNWLDSLTLPTSKPSISNPETPYRKRAPF